MLGVCKSEEGEDKSGGGWWMTTVFAAGRRGMATVGGGVAGNSGEEGRVKIYCRRWIIVTCTLDYS